ncbi:hypothetical protein [Streptomyces antimycoticus]|uniref:hypothetical protein n=1 Tax=Streptomyces antimycoticus TaxID=68175 RepID=UPI000A3CED21|nr:hypothetical protein [Streptomyces antimycoticus]
MAQPTEAAGSHHPARREVGVGYRSVGREGFRQFQIALARRLQLLALELQPQDGQPAGDDIGVGRGTAGHNRVEIRAQQLQCL